MADIEIIFNSKDSEELQEVIIISSDDEERKKVKRIVTKVVSINDKNCCKPKCLAVETPTRKRKFSEGKACGKINKRRHLSEGESSKFVNEERNKSVEMRGADVLQIDIVDEPDNVIPMGRIETLNTTRMTSAQELPLTWTEAELVADLQNINLIQAQHIVNLFNSKNTVPFVARYRKDLTGLLEPEKIRQVQKCYEQVKNIKRQINSAICRIAQLGNLTPELEKNLRYSRTVQQIEHICAPFKSTKRRPLAKRAHLLGLGETAEAVLYGTHLVDASCLVQPDIKGLRTEQDVITAMQNIIANIMSQDAELLGYLRNVLKESFICLESSKARRKIKSAKETGQMKRGLPENKLKNYYNFSRSINHLEPHQVLALNRGEKLKILRVKLRIPISVFHCVSDVFLNHWACKGIMYPFRDIVLRRSVKDSYNKFLIPLLTQEIRSELLKNAEQAAINVFALNVKNLIMTPPLRGKTILAIDPGLEKGCKVALISAAGNVLETSTIYASDTSQFSEKLKHLLFQHHCEIIALGNGNSYRLVEEYISNFIKRGWFHPLDVAYTIVSEQGASAYSWSTEANKELPNLGPNLIKAVSLARRLQDPLVELTKIEPKDFGIGMYQHDLPEDQLNATLDEVVSECASFVGVDINTAPECVLRRISGLTTAKASDIIEYRNAHGFFQNRNQLKDVESIDNKTFEQCAGFIRIDPESFNGRNINFNPLDQTNIHPESYPLAHRVIEKCGLSLQHLGQVEFRNKVMDFFGKIGTEALAADMEVPGSQIELICEALHQPLNYDERSRYHAPLFRREFKSFESLSVNSILTGIVENVTGFGAFVDIGVGCSGLIHNSSLNGMTPLTGHRVRVLVKRVNVKRKRIGLELLNIII